MSILYATYYIYNSIVNTSSFQKSIMQQITDWLYIGNYSDLISDHLKNNHSIHAVLNLAESLELPFNDVLFLDIDDGVPLKDEDTVKGLEFLLNQYYEKKVILVACGAGVSRSATFCTLVLKEILDITLIEAFKIVKQKHSKALPHPALWKSVCEVYDEEFKYVEVLAI